MEIDEPPTKKIRECGAKETQLSLILVIVTSCLMLPINICKFVLHEKLIIIKMLCINVHARGISHLSSLHINT